jgi:class 3 adenylate cyclase/pimeloyl-ACP methyl ester carboxylesterase
MDPRVHFVTSADDVSIAFWAMGQGPALVVPPSIPSSHVEMEWQIPSRRASFEALTEATRVVRYDMRGTGMSQRDAVDFSMEAAFRDLEAVVGDLGLEKFALLRLPSALEVATAYAAAHPERISHLIVWEGHAQDDLDSPRKEQTEAIEAVIDRDWSLYVKVRARLISGWESANAPLVEDILASAHSPESMKALNRALLQATPLPFLRDVQAPTLVLYRMGIQQREETARLVASRIRGAHLVGVREATTGVFPGLAGVADIIDFLNPHASSERAEQGAQAPAGSLKVILFTDLELHTVMMQRLGDERGREVLREHEALTREALHSYGGSEVKTMGDSFMATFGSATRALECGIAIQRAFQARNESGSEPLYVRVGLSAGEPIAEADDLFGSAVIMAARIAGQAKGGEILLANVVRELSAGKGFLFADRGEVLLRGFEDPVHLYELNWNGPS